ncbi:DoxX [Trichodesmium erythraeum IMS101]|uniref:DoxX n=1 Tax=Trichodesmium erythraeum (strain IMS101) TaxID=203124 RepID=Q111I4_TRIEI|nr:DoxX family protein [Trichodesmium erythraeum GBRTRLIN201]MCH2048982.1 DoxX family protein [Trichodesmium sp. ALOHA_ZT_67]MDE5094647.1 DoxX family protein [Trichodesmium sp. St11_bin5]
MKNLQPWISLLARIFLSAVFLKSGIGKIFSGASTQQYMESSGVPGWLLIPTIIVLLVGGLSVLLGYKARYGALALVGFLIPATLVFHNIFIEPAQEIAFMKNLGLIGGLLMVTSFGPGSISFDEKSIDFN